MSEYFILDQTSFHIMDHCSLSGKKYPTWIMLLLCSFLFSICLDQVFGVDLSHACANINPIHMEKGVDVILSSDRYPQPENTTGCRMWYIHGSPKETIVLSFDDLDLPTTTLSHCSGGQIIIGPDPNRTICGSLHYMNLTERAYISHRSHVWIKYIHLANQVGRGFKLTYVKGSTVSDQCPFSYFKCRSGICVLNKWLCNGAHECSDGSDEANCTKNIDPPSTLAPFDCGSGFFRCPDTWHKEVRCFPKSFLCDGKPDCIDGKDEENCGCGYFVDNLFGVITSPQYPNSYPPNKDCWWIIRVKSGSRIQIRFSDFALDTLGGDYIEIRDHSEDGPILARFDLMNPPLKLLESRSNVVALLFHSDGSGTATGFNVTYQQKGVCFSGQAMCGFDELDCYDETERCDGTWHCPLHGGDERGCRHCGSDRFSCGPGTQCYREEDRCNGIVHCSNKADETNCPETICGSHNGTFLCDNQMCIYESWHCDGANDCGDNSDEVNCPVSRKVVTAAVVGSLICALLLTIALGCTRQLHALRHREQWNRHCYRSPLTRLQDEIFARRLAPPNYGEAMISSRPFEEVRREFLEQMQAAISSNDEVDIQSVLARVMSPPTDRNHNNAQDQVTNERSSQTNQIERRHSVTSNISDDTMTNLCAGLAHHIAAMADSSNVLVNISVEEGISAQWRRSQPNDDDRSRSGRKPLNTSSAESSEDCSETNTVSDTEVLNVASCDVDGSILNNPPSAESRCKLEGDSAIMQRMKTSGCVQSDEDVDSTNVSSCQSDPSHHDNEHDLPEMPFSGIAPSALNCDGQMMHSSVTADNLIPSNSLDVNTDVAETTDGADTTPLIC